MRKWIILIALAVFCVLYVLLFALRKNNSPEEPSVQQTQKIIRKRVVGPSDILVIEKGPYAPKRITLQKGWNTIPTPAYTTAVVSDPQGGRVSTPNGETLGSAGKRFTQSEPEFRVYSEKHGVDVYLYYEYKYKSSHYVKSQLGG